MILLSTLGHLLIRVSILLGVAFITLMERKILGLSQARKGPNKVGPIGLFQPFADAVKLFGNQSTLLGCGNSKVFLFAPSAAIIVVILG